MSELRQDPTTGAYVIVAPERSRRPAGAAGHSGSTPAPAFDPNCPFCPGNEAQLPGILAETPAEVPPGWLVRVVPNKYPAVTPQPEPVASTDGAHSARPGYGFHEVIIEGPRHDADLAIMSPAELEAVVGSYHQRFCEMWRRDGVAAVILFRNHGSRSGASLVHPHAQVIALDFEPPRMRRMAEWGAHQMRETGRCPTCAELEGELASHVRIVDQSDAFVALAPYAAECPYELWLVPKRHHASFADTNLPELADMTTLLGRTLRRLKAAHDDPPYSFAIESAGPGTDGADHLHWRLRIVPDLVNWGGFERGAGMPINPSSPEADAAQLRASLIDD